MDGCEAEEYEADKEDAKDEVEVDTRYRRQSEGCTEKEAVLALLSSVRDSAPTLNLAAGSSAYTDKPDTPPVRSGEMASDELPAAPPPMRGTADEESHSPALDASNMQLSWRWDLLEQVALAATEADK